MQTSTGVSCWNWQSCQFLGLSSVPGLCTLTPSFPWPVSLSMRYTCLWQKQHHGLRCSISWLTLLTDTKSCHTYLFQPAAQNDRTSRVRFPGDVRALVGMIPAYCCDSNLLHLILERPFLFLDFVTLWWQRDFQGLTALKTSLVYSC